MVAAHVLDVAVVRALAGHLAQVPVDARACLAQGHGDRDPAFSRSRVKRPLPGPPVPAPAPACASSARSSSVQNKPAGATIRDGSAGVSVLGSGSRARIALNQTREASRITTMMSAANSAARTPSTVELVTIFCIASAEVAGATTSPESIAAWYLSRWAKKPIFGSSLNTFW